MNNEFESIINTVKHIKLSPEEKSKMRTLLMSKIDTTEASSTTVAPNSFISRIYYQSKENYNFMFNYKFVPSLIIAIVVVTTGGASVYAEKSIPGDFLYKFKTNVNEPAAGIFAFTKEERTEWKERIVERRLAEAQKLVSKNSLDEKTRLELENKIQKEIEDFSKNVEELSKRDYSSAEPSNLHMRLQASLEAYQNILSQISEETGIEITTKEETQKLLATIEDSKQKVKGHHKEMELGLGTDDDTKGSDDDSIIVDIINTAYSKHVAADRLLDSVKLSYQKEKGYLSKNIQTQVDAKLSLSDKTMNEGHVLLDLKDYVNATNKFQLVITSSNEANLLMLSNVIKGDIEDDLGIDKHGDDIDDDEFEDIEDDDDEDDFESINHDNSTSDEHEHRDAEHEEEDDD